MELKIRRIMKELIFVIFISCITTLAYAGKKPLIEGKDAVAEAAIKELSTQMLAPEGEFYLFNEEFNIQGEYTMDITIHDKGEVASVFCVNNLGGDIPTQNRLKDFVKDYEFNFKVPKGKKFKFQYIFKFD